MAKNKPSPPPLPIGVAFGTAGLGGIMGWIVVHPFNTVSLRMNLASGNVNSGTPLGFVPYLRETIKTNGIANLYQGLSAGILRQTFYATSRFGLFEIIRDEMAKHRPTDAASRLITGCISGGIAALISCPAEVTLVRISNDSSLPVDKRRNYTGLANAFSRILKEEGPAAFLQGSGPFVNRAMLVGAVQVGTYDQFRDSFRTMGITSPLTNTFCAAMSSGLIYSVLTMPLETAKNRMAFQKPLADGTLAYRGAVQTLRAIVAKEGVAACFAGFPPYYLRCGGHTVLMFMSVEWLRGLYNAAAV